MEKSLNAWKSDDNSSSLSEGHADFTCGECGKEFHKPLLAKNSSRGSYQTYYACPRCLTEVLELKKTESERSEKPFAPVKEAKRIDEQQKEDAGCQYSFGYLKRRPKDTAIPEDCLTCERMIDCMVR